MEVRAGGISGAAGRADQLSPLNRLPRIHGATRPPRHLSKYAVDAGQTVERGQLIGSAGSTGNSTGPHLHLEVRYNGVGQNPFNYLP